MNAGKPLSTAKVPAAPAKAPDPPKIIAFSKAFFSFYFLAKLTIADIPAAPKPVPAATAEYVSNFLLSNFYSPNLISDRIRCLCNVKHSIDC